MGRFDSLVHVTRDGRWIDGRHDASHSRLMQELDRGEVSRACLVGLAGVVDNEYVVECAHASGGRLVPIAGVDPRSLHDESAATSEVIRLAHAGFAGIKLHPRLSGFDPVGPPCVRAIRAAASNGLVIFLDTLFRQQAHATVHAADVIDELAHECAGAPIVLLHGGGPALLEVAEVVRVHPSLVLDLSFTLVHYAGSSVDDDIRWVMEHLDRRVTIGSDMPEITPTDAFARAEAHARGLSPEKWANIAHRNLERLFPCEAARPCL
jgi:predicted TIM-barrel fold metal-dependent hydrolase